PALAAALERLGLRTLQDLWFHLPLRYEDRTRITAIRDLRAGETAQVEGRVEAIERGFRYPPQLRIAIRDASQRTPVHRFFPSHPRVGRPARDRHAPALVRRRAPWQPRPGHGPPALPAHRRPCRNRSPGPPHAGLSDDRRPRPETARWRDPARPGAIAGGFHP